MAFAMRAAVAAAVNAIVTAALVIGFFIVAIALAWPQHHFATTRLLRVAAGFGFSPSNRESSWNVLLERLPATIELLTASVILAVIVSLALVATAGFLRSEPLRRALGVLGSTLSCIPFFWLLLFAQLLAAITGALPQAGNAGMDRFDLADRLSHLMLPASLLALFQLPALLGSFSGSLDNNAGVKSFAADGLKTFTRGLPQLVAASLLVEIIFAWPSVGRVYWGALQQSDASLVIAVTCLSACGVIAVRFVAEAISG